MKLELKHLVPYLPYGLRYSFDNVSYWRDANLTYTAIRFDLGTLTRLTAPEHTANVIGVKWDDDKNGLSAFTELSSVYHKPILRPMSELNSPMLEEAGFFCHIDYLTNEFKHWCNKDGREHVVNNLPYGHFIWLVKNHYDIFGLIPAGLAVNINTI